ncbi:MAG: hypothetical protein A3D94_00575 [Alphaproteobacteria bacterium RIFCSPHIGHO2_12_FULL_66_14]|nr:MAG: hypothetical protein A3D94_00575 [Alphaproteobacteria bacterium RIFCSPHIGHO2_12_FULL_66_14]
MKMKLEIARVPGEIRRLCIIAEETTPRWSRVLFAASLLTMWLVGQDRSNALGPFIAPYLILTWVLAGGTGLYIAVTVYKGYLARRAASR